MQNPTPTQTASARPENVRITNEQIESQELYSLGEAILNGSLELNSEFIKRYCGQSVAAQLLRLPEKDRAYALEGNLGEGYFPGGIGSLDDNTIVLPHGEIEFQFEGEAFEVFETPDDLTINGNLAYLYTGYGAVFQVDIDGLTKAINDQLNP